jgi:hypothetical protein
MPYSVSVNRSRGFVWATWDCTVTDELLSDYQQSVWGDPSIAGYDELADLRVVTAFSVTPAGLRRLASIAASMDDPNRPSKFAIVASTASIYGLARMYEAYRELNPHSNKEVSVFEDIESALAWLCPDLQLATD